VVGLRDWVPSGVLRLGRVWSGRGVRFRGEYASWRDAAAQGDGYDSDAILSRVLNATLAVRDGQAAFERDGVLFAAPEHPYPLLAGLLRVAANCGGRLDVLDFGGALGSSYFQCKPWLTDLPALRWCVVEQPHFVARGRERVADGVLRFAESIENCVADGTPSVALFSGVLQYLEHPRDILDKISSLGIRHVIIDRTPIIEGDRDVISVQVVPARIVQSSYPIWLFSRDTVLRSLESTYRVISEFPAVDGVLGGLRRRVEFRGFILERKGRW
jgi:putative methyltransferase (TIGR04325 family)